MSPVDEEVLILAPDRVNRRAGVGFRRLDALGTLSQNRPDGFDAALAWHQQSAETLVRVSTSRPLDARELDQLALSQAHTAIDHCALEQPDESKVAFGRTREVGGHRLPAVADELAVIEATLTKFGCDPN